jgi:hypothetical protein
MNPWKKVRTYMLMAIMLAGGLAVGERVGIPGVHGLISAAEAVVGRPLTPVSVAGVARRTSRRCAAGVTC